MFIDERRALATPDLETGEYERTDLPSKSCSQLREENAELRVTIAEMAAGRNQMELLFGC